MSVTLDQALQAQLSLDPDREVVMISGGAQRVGEVISRHCHEKGLNVLVHHNRSAQAAQILVGELNKKRPHSAAIVTADFTQVDAVATLLMDIQTLSTRCDYFIHSASAFLPSDFHQESLKMLSEHWDQLMACHAKFPYLLTREISRSMGEHFKSMVGICDIYASIPLQNYSSYSISKAALAMTLKALAKELGPQVRVNGIAPGLILLPDGQQVDDGILQRMETRTALKRPGEPIDIAKSCYHLLVEARYVTGHILTIDGGRTLYC